MKAVVLAAGEGSRMRPLTYTRPKVMLPIANRPLLEHLLIEARMAGIGEFVFVVGYREEQVRDHFGDGEEWGVRIEYLAQRRQLGTADAIGLASGLVEGKFLALNGDVLVKAEDIAALATGSVTTLSLFRVEDARDLGVVAVAGERVTRIYEKVARPPSDLANAGLYLFTPAIFTAISRIPRSPRGEYEITDAIQLLIDQGEPVAHRELGYWLDLSYPWDLLSANEALLGKLEPGNQGEAEPNTVLKGPVAIGQNTVVHSGSYIVGPVVIGRDCVIGPNCFIRPSTAIGDGCHIGAAVEVKNSIIMRDTTLPHLNYVGDSVIGAGCNLGAGTKVANLRLDKQSIRVGQMDTKRRKLGAIIGDDVQTGINVSINVGCLIGNGARIGPGALAHGVITPNSRIF